MLVRQMASSGLSGIFFKSLGCRVRDLRSRGFRIAFRQSCRRLHTQLVDSRLIPEGWPRDVEHRFESLQETSFLAREVSSDLSRDVILPLAKGSGCGRFVLIDGERGVGKSAMLLQAVEEARKSGVLVMYIPRGRDWTHGDGFFSATYEDDNWQTGAVRWYDRPKQTRDVMAAFWSAHGEVLGKLKIKGGIDELAGNRVTTLGDLVQLSVQISDELDNDWKSGPRRASDAMCAVLQELAMVTEVPVAIAIDEFDSMLGMTCMKNDRGRVLHAHAIRVIAQWLGQTAALEYANSLQKGVVIAAISCGRATLQCRRKRILGTEENPLPESILNDPHGVQWLEDVRGRVKSDQHKEMVYVLKVPPLSGDEAGFITSQLQNRKGRDRGDNSLGRLHVLSGGRVDILHKMGLTL